jgi:hypothetical protein
MPRLRKKDSGLTKAEADGYRLAAMREYSDEGRIEVDDDAPISASKPIDGGVYVQAWVWVYGPEKDEDDDDLYADDFDDEDEDLDEDE